MIILELSLILLLILANGFLALSELAIVSARRPRLQAMAERRRPGARMAMALAAEPGRFLSSVQIGITLIGVLAGAFGGATVAESLARLLETMGVQGGLSETLALAAVVAAITYLSLIAGELVPKQLALRNPEAMACFVAPAMRTLSILAAPLVTAIDLSAQTVLRLLGAHGPPQQRVSDEEIRMLIAEAESAGVVRSAERDMIGAVMRLSDKRVRALMTPRPEIDWIDIEEGEAGIRQAILASRHSRLPVARGSVDRFEGVVAIRDILEAQLAGKPLDMAGLMRTPPIFHETADALFVVETLRDADHHMGLVLDEYGSVEGLVTRADILEAIIGEMKEAGPEEGPSFVQREDGSWLIDGAAAVDEMADRIGFPLAAKRDYQTVAGFVLAELRQLPRAGDRFVSQGWSFEVVDMDDRRVDKIIATRLPERRAGRA